MSARQNPQAFDGRSSQDEHPLEGGQTDAVDEAQETAHPSTGSVPGGSLLIRYPDGAETVESFADNGAVPRRGDEVTPGWIVDQIEVRDGRDQGPVADEEAYVEVSVVPSAEFVA